MSRAPFSAIGSDWRTSDGLPTYLTWRWDRCWTISSGVGKDSGNRQLNGFIGNLDIRKIDPKPNSSLERRTMNAVASRNGETNFRGATIVVPVIGSLMLAPPVYSIHKLGIEAVFNFFAQDAFAYLAVAQHSTMGFYSFDGELATNGFHPLWQMYLTGLFHWAQNTDQVFQLYVVFFHASFSPRLDILSQDSQFTLLQNRRFLAILTVPGIFYLTFSFVMRFLIHRGRS